MCVKVSCSLPHDNTRPEVVGQLTLAETGEMLDSGMVASVSPDLANRTDLSISGLRPGQYLLVNLNCKRRFSVPGTTYTVKIQVRNKFGTSDSVYIPMVTKLEPIKLLAETKVKNEEGRTELLGMIIGSLVTAVLLVTVVLLVSFNYRRRMLEQSAATISSTSAPLLESTVRDTQATDFSTFTINSKQSTTTTFNSNVFVPSISSDIYGQVRTSQQLRLSVTVNLTR